MVEKTIAAAKKRSGYLRLESRCALENALGQALGYTPRNTYGEIVSASDEWDIIEHQTLDTSVANSKYGPGTSFQTGNQFLDDIRVGVGQKPIDNTQTFTVGHDPQNPKIGVPIRWGSKTLPSDRIQMSINGVWVNGQPIPDKCEYPNR